MATHFIIFIFDPSISK